MNRHTAGLNRLSLAIMLAGTGITAPAALAQGNAEGLEEITVTARKREENIQDVAIAVTAARPSEAASTPVQSPR